MKPELPRRWTGGRPITNFTEAAQKRREYWRAYYDKHKERLRSEDKNPCPDCGRTKGRYSARCRSCADIAKVKKAHQTETPLRRYHREYMRRYRQQTDDWKFERLRRRSVKQRLCRVRDCLYRGSDHHHCLCGLVLAPDKWACPWCIAEQSRIEFKTWPREAA